MSIDKILHFLQNSLPAISSINPLSQIQERNKLTALLEVVVTDESIFGQPSSSSSSSHPSTAVYQIWGQVARDKFRYAVRPGCVLLIKNFSAKCVRLHRTADPGHEAAYHSVAVGAAGGDGDRHRGNSLLVLQEGQLLILDDVIAGNNTNQPTGSDRSSRLLSSVFKAFQWIQAEPALSAIRDSRQLVQSVSKVSDIPKSDGIFLFSVDLQLLLSARDILPSDSDPARPVVVSCLDSDSSSVQLELRPEDIRYLVAEGVSAGQRGSPRGPPIAVHVTAVQVAGCYQNFVKLLRMTKFSSIVIVDEMATSATAHRADSGGGGSGSAVTAASAVGSDETDSVGDRLGHSVLAGLEMISWDEFKGLFCTDLKTLQCHFGKKKLVKCSLKRVQFESSIGCHSHTLSGQVRARSYLRNNFDVWRLPATSDGDPEVAGCQPNLLVTYRDALFTLGKPNDPDLVDLFTQLTSEVRATDSSAQRLQEVLTSLLNSFTQVDPASHERSRSALPLSMQLSLSGSDCHSHTFMQSNARWMHSGEVEISAVAHHDALQAVFCSLPAELVAASIAVHDHDRRDADGDAHGHGHGHGHGHEQAACDYRAAYVRLLQALESAASPSSSEDFLFVLRICPKIDDEGEGEGEGEDDHALLVSDVLVSVEAMLVI